MPKKPKPEGTADYTDKLQEIIEDVEENRIEASNVFIAEPQDKEENK